MPKEPAIGPAGPRASFEPTHGALFDGAPKGNEVVQQALGDCFFLSAVASLAQRRPGAIERAIRDRGDGTYTVRLFRKDPTTGAFVADPVVVDDTLPEERGRALYAKLGDHHDLWIALLEKAYAVRRGGYGRLDRGGVATTAMEALTGEPARMIYLARARPDEIWALLGEAVAARRLTTADTYDAEKVRTVLAQREARDAAARRDLDPATFSYARRGLVAAHEYTAWGLREAAGAREIVLRNPWGSGEPAGNGKDDGIFALAFETFMEVFETLSIGG